MVNLWADIEVALRNSLKLVHLTAAPISVSEVAKEGLGLVFDRVIHQRPPAYYDMQSCYGGLFGGDEDYQYSRRESIQAIRCFAQSEQKAVRR